MNTAEPLVSDISPFEVETASAVLKKYNSPGSDQISALTDSNWRQNIIVYDL
jgi:hypothetical protein